METETMLVREILAGDALAVRRLYGRVERRLRIFFQSKTVNKEDAEELLQDTFLHFLDALPLFRSQSLVMTFLMGIARHELMDYWRKKYAKRVIRTVGRLDDMANSIYDRTLVSNKMNAALERAYAQLNPIQTRLLKWKYEEGRSVKEIAGLLGWSLKAVEAQLYRSRKAFQRAYVPTEEYF